MNWCKSLKNKVEFNKPLKHKTTFKIGGAAKYFYCPANLRDLRQVLLEANRYKLPIFVLGAGSNILVSDSGVSGLVLKFNAPEFKKIKRKDNFLGVGSGLMLKDLILAAKKYSLSGMEFLIGIPGTVGGAMIMNAGGWGRGIGDLVEEIKVMDYNGRVKSLKGPERKFGYRKSGLAKYVILSATLKLNKTNKKEIDNNIQSYLKERKATQNIRLPNAGCIFKNPNTQSAGFIIDRCGLKGRMVGDAVVSVSHANFIVNRGHAKAQDVLKLMDLVKKEVKNKFGLKLEPEIKIWE